MRYTPILLLHIGYKDNKEKAMVVINEEREVLGAREAADTPFCSSLPTHNLVPSTLRSSDVQGLLASFTKGTSVLNGPLEPLIWLPGRVADWRRDPAERCFETMPGGHHLGKPRVCPPDLIRGR